VKEQKLIDIYESKLWPS